MGFGSLFKKPTEMNYLEDYANFETVEDGEQKLKEAYALRDKMGGDLYRSALTDDCHEISRKLERFKRLKYHESKEENK